MPKISFGRRGGQADEIARLKRELELVKEDRDILKKTTAFFAREPRSERELKLYTVAEGIETSEQLELLRELGCDQGQGHYFTASLSASNAQAMLEQLGSMKGLSNTVRRRMLRRVV
ncbi:MAG: EAL domain-containing protein [Steroidobacter sp.]